MTTSVVLGLDIVPPSDLGQMHHHHEQWGRR